MTIISIITPSYNQKDLLQRCIASVRDQVSEDLIIFHHIQDGGSTDGTSEWLADNERFLTVDGGYHFSYKSEDDDSMYDALNRGIEYILISCPNNHIDSSAVAWLNCDEQYLPGTLIKVANQMKAHPCSDFFYGNTLHVDLNGKLLTYRKNPPLRKIYVEAAHLYIQSASLFFRRSVFSDGTRFNTSMKSISDCILMIDLLKKGKRGVRINEYYSVFTMTGSNLSIEDVGLQEIADWRDQAHLITRLLRPLINGLRFIEKFLLGSYSERFPLNYSIYINDTFKRKYFSSASGSWKFTWGNNNKK